jgi:hypothetical protein
MRLLLLGLSMILAVSTAVLGADQPEPTSAREYAKIMFHHAVKVGDRVLMGPYVIEHDNDRMARGRPCTYIYVADDMRLPVVAFHCRHLHRKATDRPTVTLRRLPETTGPAFELIEFQFAGSGDGHGVPGVR